MVHWLLRLQSSTNTTCTLRSIWQLSTHSGIPLFGMEGASHTENLCSTWSMFPLLQDGCSGQEDISMQENPLLGPGCVSNDLEGKCPSTFFRSFLPSQLKTNKEKHSGPAPATHNLKPGHCGPHPGPQPERSASKAENSRSSSPRSQPSSLILFRKCTPSERRRGSAEARGGLGKPVEGGYSG